MGKKARGAKAFARELEEVRRALESMQDDFADFEIAVNPSVPGDAHRAIREMEMAIDTRLSSLAHHRIVSEYAKQLKEHYRGVISALAKPQP